MQSIVLWIFKAHIYVEYMLMYLYTEHRLCYKVYINGGQINSYNPIYQQLQYLFFKSIFFH